MENHKSKKIYNILKVFIKMEKTVIKFGDTEIEKHKFPHYKKPISLKV